MNTNKKSRLTGKENFKNISGSEALLLSLLNEGVKDIFGYPGGQAIPIYDSLHDYNDRLNHILVRHEQGATHVAQGFARVTGGPVTDITAVHVESLLALTTGETGRQAVLPHGYKGKRVYGQLVLYRTQPESAGDDHFGMPVPKPAGFCYTLTPETLLRVPEMNATVFLSLQNAPPEAKNGYTKNFRYDNMTIMLRTRRPGDRIQLENGGRQKIQDYFTDRKIPRDKRDSIPLLAAGGEILWIMDDTNRVSGAYRAEPGRPAAWVTVCCAANG